MNTRLILSMEPFDRHLAKTNLRSKIVPCLCAFAIGLGLGYGTQPPPQIIYPVEEGLTTSVTAVQYSAMCRARIRGYYSYYRGAPKSSNPYKTSVILDGEDVQWLLSNSWIIGWNDCKTVNETSDQLLKDSL